MRSGLRLLALRHHGELVAVLPLVPHACPLADRKSVV